MKKTIALLLALVMLAALAACGGDTGSSNPGTSNPGTSAPSDTNPGTPDTDTPDADTPDTDDTLQPTGDPIKIGHLVDLQGAEAMTGEEAKRSLEFAVKNLGGQIAGHPVEIVLGDAQGTTAGAVDAAHRMVENDGVVAIFGPTQAGEKTAVAEYAKETGIPLIFYNGTPSYLFATNEWLVGAGGANPQLTVMADFVYNTLGYRSVHILTMDNVGFRTFTDDFAKAFTSLGGTIESSQYAPITGCDWAPYLTGLSDADAIMAWTTGTNSTALWTAWYEMGISERMPITAIMQSAFTEYYIMEALETVDPAMAEAVLGTYSPAMYVYNIDTPENKEFVEAWTEEFGAVPATNLPGQVYQAYQLLKEGIESIDGDTSPDALIEALLSCDITGPAGHMSFDGRGACTKDVYITQLVRLEDGSYNYQVVKTYENVGPNGILDD